MVAKEMIRHGYKLGKGLGKSLQGIAEPITLTASEKFFGVGFRPTPTDIRWADDRKNDGWVLPQPVPHLYRTFVKPKYNKEKEDKAFTVEEIEDICGAMRKILYETHMVQPGEGSSTAEVLSEEVRETKISIFTGEKTRDALIQLLLEFKDVFAWSYGDMPGLSVDLVVHKLPTYPDCPPVQQKQRKFKTDVSDKIKEEVTKQLKARVIRVVRYTTWLANVVPVPKKDVKTRVCVDYRDLNKASPKDNFPFPNIHILVDNCAKHEIQSFVDCYAGYHQVLMDEEDAEKTTFTTPWVLENSFGCVLGQYDVTGKREHAIYYLSKNFTSYEAKYTLLERTCYALTWVAQKLRHYLQAYTTYLITRLDPLKYIFQKTMPTGRLAKWQILLTEFDIVYVTRMTMKAQALADHLAENPVDDEYQPLNTYFPDEEGEWETRDVKLIPYRQQVEELGKRFKSIEFSQGMQLEAEKELQVFNGSNPRVWTLFTDSTSNVKGAGLGIILVPPTGETIRQAIKCHSITNNEAEYEAVITGLELARELDVSQIVIKSDSQLIVNQMLGTYQMLGTSRSTLHWGCIQQFSYPTTEIGNFINNSHGCRKRKGKLR
ncbi:uncharacterized protein [Nicotiana sylvestris]|uniref:uncharacterized protein n=1 Tax=Nicotiana sylvestris TaxID=4096 RepID=UPI00388CD82D